MALTDNLRLGIDAMMNPGKLTKRGLSLGNALKFYYGLSIFPLLLYVLLGYALIILNHLARRVFLLSSLLSGVGYFWILVPACLFIDALVYQVVGKFFLNVWNGNYERTFAAATFGAIPAVLFYWLMLLPSIRALYVVIFGAWGLVVLTIAISNQQKASRLASFAVLAATVAFALFIIFGTVAILSTSFAGL